VRNSYTHTIHDDNVDRICQRLDRIADALERLADKVAPTPEQLEDQAYRKSRAALELLSALARWTAIPDRP
jgi:plasmid stabilization system protein ParE